MSGDGPVCDEEERDATGGQCRADDPEGGSDHHGEGGGRSQAESAAEGCGISVSGFGVFARHKSYCYKSHEALHELRRYATGTRVDANLDGADLRINALHEVDDEADDLFSLVILQHGIGDEETNVVILL